MIVYRLTEFYGSYVDQFYENKKQPETANFQDQLEAFFQDGFSWFGSWQRALRKKKIESYEMAINALPLLKAYAKENGLKVENKRQLMRDVTLHHIKSCKPDVLWFDCHRTELLEEIKNQNPNIKMTLGWVGSAIPKTDVWKHMDLILTCAPESHEWFQKQSLKSRVFHHGFDPQIAEPVPFEQKNKDVAFVGQIIRTQNFHFFREQMLLDIVKNKHPLKIYSPSGSQTLKQYLRSQAEKSLFDVFSLARKLGATDAQLKKLPVVGPAANWHSRPGDPIHPKLRKAIIKPVYGKAMLEALSKSLISLNIHADSSPVYASNMRLFEATGMASCLLTESKRDLDKFFALDREVVTYSSVPEAEEKIRWLLDNPSKAAEIAKAGRDATLRKHTFDNRAEELLELLDI